MAIQRLKYIPAGCFSIKKDLNDPSNEHWKTPELREWKLFAAGDGESAGMRIRPIEQYLQPELQYALLKKPEMRAYAPLVRADWIQCEFKLNAADPERGIVRVYLLPDDLDRASLDRSDPKLKKARQALLQSLDYSEDAWKGCCLTFAPGNYPLYSPTSPAEDEDMSLLQLFNTIPSPSPSPERVQDTDHYDAMLDTLDGRIPGLSSDLYPHQKRSAALMLQKEAQPGQSLDPRLLRLKDHRGSSWYLDPVAGTVVEKPNVYDDVCGGILAEEMGAGKTIICLALILATRLLPTRFPEDAVRELPLRPRVGSLVDMAASCANRQARAWKTYYNVYRKETGYEFDNCIKALERNPASYYVPALEPRRRSRHNNYSRPPPTKIYMSDTTIIVVPNNLIAQWTQEIKIHTEGLNVLVMRKGVEIPAVHELRKYDMILFPQSRFESLLKQDGGIAETPLAHVHFKRCIVDEGHKLGNSRMGNRSNLLLGLDALRVSARWIVTGTPSRGLFGLDGSVIDERMTEAEANGGKSLNETSTTMEKEDLERIGSMAALYLKARPWANTIMEGGDTPADWTTYLMLPKHNPRSRGRWDCLQSTLSSLIIRHQRHEVGDLLPPVDEKVVVLDGSYQDQLSLSIFSMMIIFNTVQSQRTDRDYFFHPKQRKSLLQIVHNLKQTSFFGGSFFTSEEIATSVKTAEKFLEEGNVAINSEDEALLRSAIRLGHLAMANKLRNLSNMYHEMPVSVIGFPGGAGQSWSLDGEPNDIVCTSSSMLLALQKRVYSATGAALNSLLNGGLIRAGLEERDKILAVNESEKTTKSQTLAGNTKLGDDNPKKARSHGVNGIEPKNLKAESFSGPMELTKITSTVSAKLSYLVDGIIKHQEQEKIIIFYENDNVAWYLAGMLDVLQIQHLIYAKGITNERRSQYVNTFHHNPTFRVLLMDISQAAFGLDMKGASRIYFINPVLNPQVEAQAIGRVRRISQQKKVSVETLVLKNSIDEVILERKNHMTQAEHRQVKSILDIRPIYNWIKNASIIDLPEGYNEAPFSTQMTALREAQCVFGRGFGRDVHPDDGLMLEEPHLKNGQAGLVNGLLKRTRDERGLDDNGGTINSELDPTKLEEQDDPATRPARRVRFG